MNYLNRPILASGSCSISSKKEEHSFLVIRRMQSQVSNEEEKVHGQLSPRFYNTKVDENNKMLIISRGNCEFQNFYPLLKQQSKDSGQFGANIGQSFQSFDEWLYQMPDQTFSDKAEWQKKDLKYRLMDIIQYTKKYLQD